MAKFDLKFIDNNFDSDYIKVQVKNDLIQITSSSFSKNVIVELDKSTAIKFAKTLRTEINKITERQ